jgi:hypothetical protein
MRVKIEIKNKLEGETNFFIRALNWKKIILTKWENQKNEDRTRKIIHHKIGLNDKIEKQ